MASISFVKSQRVWLSSHPQLNEKWVQEQIASDPSILGLGDVVLRDKERPQPGAGRLDLLLQDVESSRRYEVEIQLGRTDESHIIRTIEYWDIERKRYPQYDHCAVIVAEEITARFLNVISLFNGHIPLIAIQMSALQVADHMTLTFTTVLNALSLGLVDEDEEIAEVTDRAYWEERGTPSTVAIADQLLEIIHTFDPAFELKYNKFYIGLAKEGRPDNFVSFFAKKKSLRLELRLPKSQEIDDRLEAANLDLMDYHDPGGRYRIRLAQGDLKAHGELLTSLLKAAYQNGR